MAILNSGWFYRLSYFEEIMRVPIEQALMYCGLARSSTSYYYLECPDPEQLKTVDIASIMPCSLFSQIRCKDDNTTLLIVNKWEPHHSIVGHIYEYVVKKFNIPPEKILLWSNSFDISTEVIRVAKEKNSTPIQNKTVVEFEEIASTAAALRKKFQFPKTLQDVEYNKKFLCFNRKFRPHRAMLVALMESRGLLGEGFLSISPEDFGKTWEDFYHISQRSQHVSTIIKQTLAENRNKIFNIGSLHLDMDDLSYHDLSIILQTNLKQVAHFYEKTYFSLVTETNYHKHIDPGRFLTEKIFKPIFFKHPFVLVTRPHTLKILKKLGYKTFEGIINEEYDQIEDDNDRMLAIVEEVDRLCNLTGADLTDFLSEARKICNYNFQLLCMKRKFAYSSQ